MKDTREPLHTENQAATWLVRLDADSSAENVRHWQAWLKEDVRHRATFVRLEEGWRRLECLKSLKPLDGAVNPNVLDTFPGVAPSTLNRIRRDAETPGAASSSPDKPKVALADLAIQTVAVALAAAMLAGKLVLCCWLFINLDGWR